MVDEHKKFAKVVEKCLRFLGVGGIIILIILWKLRGFFMNHYRMSDDEDDFYYFINLRIYSRDYVEPDPVKDKEIILKVLNMAFPIDKISWEEIIDFAKTLRHYQQYEVALDVCNTGLEKFRRHKEYVNAILPVMASVYRLMGQPQQAIEFAQKSTRRYRTSYSTALLTSVAAAYCDLGDIENATKFADAATANKARGKEEKDDLALVYEQIENLSINMSKSKI